MDQRGDHKKLDNLKSLEEVIYPEIEPGIISKQMIEKSYLEDGHKGEAARLHQMEPVVYERITALRLEFKSKTSVLTHPLPQPSIF